MSNDARISAAGDSAIVVEFPTRTTGFDVDVEANARAIALATRVRSQSIPGVLDVVPAIHTLGIHFHPLRTDIDRLIATVAELNADTTSVMSWEGKRHQIPVCYGGEFGPDLGDVAASAGLSEDAVVAAHAGVAYRVFMLGFTAGFAYMGPLSSSIVVARRSTPRTMVPRGAVAIAGRHTGIYPSASPGGWHVIGRTAVRPFAVDRSAPFLFAAGDTVEFYAVEAQDFGEPA